MAGKPKRGLTERSGLLGSILRAFTPGAATPPSQRDEPTLGELGGQVAEVEDDDPLGEFEEKTIVGFGDFDQE